MEGLGAEVSAKIRSAIKAKLIELEAYVDDELPDYIMVMVANNRTKAQMEDDLGLFLNNNTAAFTNWLHAVLEKLKKVTLEEVSKKDVKKKKVKKVSEKSTKKPSKEIKDTLKEKPKDKPRDNREEKKPVRSSQKSSRGSKKPPAPKGNNANMEELGERRKMQQSDSVLDNSGGSGGYNPASLLKSAVDKSKKKGSPRRSPKKPVKKSSNSSGKDVSRKTESEKESIKAKNIINLKEEENFYNPKAEKVDKLGISRHREERSPSPRKSRVKNSRIGSRSKSRERLGSQVTSLASKVVRPAPRSYRSRSRSSSRGRAGSVGEYDPMAMLSSRAQVPPRPSRPPGREEKGVARAVNRAMLDADRSIMRGKRKGSPETSKMVREEPKYKEVSEARRPQEKDVRRGERSRDRPPRLSPDDIERFEKLKRNHGEMEGRKVTTKDRRQRDRDLRDRRREEVMRLGRRVAGGQEDRKRVGGKEERRLAMDEEIGRSGRASSLDRKLLKKREEKKRGHREDDDLRIIVRREVTPEAESPPPKRRLEDEDAELLEMRRKALESLMKRTDRDIRRSSSRERRSGSSSSDSESSGESEASLTDTENAVTAEKEVKKPEPTFIVTMDGIEDINKYFKKSSTVSEDDTGLTQPPASKSKEIKDDVAIESKASSDAELELYADEDFDEEPNVKMVKTTVKEKASKKISSKTSESSEKPTMKVAARKRSPVLAPNTAKDSTATSQPPVVKVAAVKPVVSSKPETTSKVKNSAAKLAAAYAAKLTAIKAAKPKISSNTDPSKPTTVPSTTEAPNKSTAAVSPIKTPVSPSKTAVPAFKATAPVVKKVPGSPSVRIKTIPAKPAADTVPSSAVAPAKRKFTPIQAPSPDPPSRPTVNRLKSVPLPPAPEAGSVCKFWPKCVRKETCAFYHPPPRSADVVVGGGGANRYKWSAN